MVARMNITVSAPLPTTLPARELLDALHASYEALILPHPYLRTYTRRRLSVSEVVDDPFFRADGTKLEAYEVVERVPILPVPGFHKDITIPAVFQSFEGGVRCRADSFGVRIWSTYEVRPAAPTTPPSGGEGEAPGVKQQQQLGGGGWELFETAKVECSPFVKPFVQKSFEHAHREILKGTIDLVAKRNEPAPTALAR